MNMTMNPEPIYQAVVALLAADATLNGATCLGEPGHIFYAKAPNDAKAPFLVVTMDMLAPDEMQQYIAEVRVYVYTKLLANGQIDPKGSQILSQCESLLNDATLQVTGVTVQPLITLAVVPNVYDAQDASKSRGILRLRLEAGKNG